MKMIRAQAKAFAGSPATTRLLFAAVACGLLGGCNKGMEVNGAPPAALPAPSNATAYIGSQSPGDWTLSVDDVGKVYGYQALTTSSAASGGLINTNGVLDLGNSGGISFGKAVEQPGVGAVLRPGSVAASPVAMVPQADCVPITTKTRYIYAAVAGPGLHTGGGGASSTGYGTFVVSTGADGKSVNFTDVHNYVVTSLVGFNQSAGTENGLDPLLFSGACASAGGVGTVSADAKAAFRASTSGMPAVPTFHFNSIGTFTEDRPTDLDGGWVGFAMPTVAIKASSVAAAGAYRGFFSEGTDKVPVDTEAVAFAQISDGAASLTGGAFLNDDLTQTPGGEYTITLGTQDTTYNGVFPNARLIVADALGICANVATADSTVQSSIDASGKVICTAAGVGVVSQVNGKYVIFFTSHDGTRPTASTQSYLIQFYLYQQ